jgi:hypothetical protein
MFAVAHEIMGNHRRQSQRSRLDLGCSSQINSTLSTLAAAIVSFVAEG